jgi:hypothetical protein
MLHHFKHITTYAGVVGGVEPAVDADDHSERMKSSVIASETVVQ